VEVEGGANLLEYSSATGWTLTQLTTSCLPVKNTYAASTPPKMDSRTSPSSERYLNYNRQFPKERERERSQTKGRKKKKKKTAKKGRKKG